MYRILCGAILMSFKVAELHAIRCHGVLKPYVNDEREWRRNSALNLISVLSSALPIQILAVGT